MSKEKEKAALGAKTLKDFFEDWGNDKHSNILLEILFEGIMKNETLFIFGESQQTRSETDNDYTDQQTKINSTNKN